MNRYEERSIENEKVQERFKILFKNKLNIILDDFNFCNCNREIRFHHNGRDLKIEYDEFNDMYKIYHKNTAKNRGGKKEHYHKHYESTAIYFIVDWLSTFHSPSNMNNKTEKMFNKIKTNKI